MTLEQAPAWRDPGGRHRDGPGAFPSEQHPPPPQRSLAACVLGRLRAVELGELVLVGMPANGGERSE